MIPLKAIQPPHSPALVFPGLEIRLHKLRVLKGGTDIYLTRLEYDALCYLAANTGKVFTDEDFAIACMRSNLKYGKNQKRET